MQAGVLKPANTNHRSTITSQTQQEEEENDDEDNDAMVPIKIGTVSTANACIILFFFHICIFVIYACHCPIIDRILHESNNRMYNQSLTNGIL